jgi:hypothetical protein
MILRVLILWHTLVFSISLSEASTFLHGVSGGATLTKDIPQVVQPTTADVDDEVHYIIKRDGRREQLDGNKVSRESCITSLIQLSFFLTGSVVRFCGDSKIWLQILSQRLDRDLRGRKRGV